MYNKTLFMYRFPFFNESVRSTYEASCPIIDSLYKNGAYHDFSSSTDPCNISMSVCDAY